MPCPLVIDTDPGIDDMFALLVAAGSGELNVLEVTTTYGNVDVDTATRNARRILALAGRNELRVSSGATRPLVRPWQALDTTMHGPDGLGGQAARLPEASRPHDTLHAIDAMADAVEGSAEPVTLVVLGPATNAALFHARYPELAARLERTVMMGGSVAGGNVTSVAEFNVACDPEATQRVLSDGPPVLMIGLDVTRQVAVDQRWADRLRLRGPVASIAMDVLQHYLRHAHARGRSHAALHDALVIAELIAPGMVGSVAADVEVDTGQGAARGCTVVRTHDAGRHQVAMSVDADAARSVIAERIATVTG